MDYDEFLDNFKDILKKNSLKYTKQRELIIETIFNDREHHTPEEIYMLIKEQNPDINLGIATVYRTLSILEESDLVSSISFGADGKKYELSLKEHHDHLVCDECGKIIEFHNEIIEHQQELIAKEFNFKMTSHIMQLVGICQECQDKK
ncbi:Ferric uptake regulation protein FUR [hydrothermal vent metagenome]|uniref:Ferric uptake regulation protein FUR n=1 Tax=hydrothermal vent metagenome TaxID=652676 RepID=A0A1W1EJI7_9ZZZZ